MLQAILRYYRPRLMIEVCRRLVIFDDQPSES
jgi:hypothetical protein